MLRSRTAWLRADGGYTITESTVALALLLTVLVPAAGTLTYLATQQRTRHTVEALAIAQQAMERTLASGSFSSPEAHSSTEEASGPWRVVTLVEDRGRLALITVEVYRHSAERLTLKLSTARLRDQAGRLDE